MDIRYEVVTNLTKTEVRSELETSLKEEGFGILWELNMKDKLQEKGLEFDRDFVVLEVCNPMAAKKVLDIDISAGYFLPCKMTIYEEKGNQVLGLILPTTLIALQENPALKSLAEEVEEALIRAINNVVK
ncbi:DUF302 domain-containing protein [Petrocella sp. FN5]|uniref:DUF302 domain-containing protein n=1 Tax=Petrocella sp. FN5 TaxID=3032002 RepID=UPI0023D9AB9C|nr:DUF302 domain-containing protein [Petrocella sp. FN5]MDF1617737.1 DUF302 domain-containing protein [Petrocella sp. FN5]